MITKESRKYDAVIDHLILKIRAYWQVYLAVKERKKRYRNLATDFLYRLYSMFRAMLDSCLSD